tara:strand:+ start:4068 stop:5006 length:939 start_codon:yes stop_codon:yes gene_type:complete
MRKIITMKENFLYSIFLYLMITTSAYSQWESDRWLDNPVSDEIFATYLEFFEYEKELEFNLNVREKLIIDGIYMERITFQSTRNVNVTADYYKPDGISYSNERPHIIIVHGGTPKGKDGVKRVVKGLIRNGMNVLAIDMLHFGERKTGLLKTFKNDEKANNLYNRKSEYLDWVIQTTKDVSRSFDLLENHYKAKNDKIAYLGISRGAQVGFIVTGVEKRFGAVALLIAGHLDALETGHLAAACPANYVGRIAPTPTFLLNGEFDSDYDADKSVKPLHKLFDKRTSINWVQSGHTITEEGLILMNSWLSQTLR